MIQAAFCYILQDIAYSGLLQTVNIQTLDSSYFSRTEASQTITANKQFTGPVTVVTGGTLDVDGLTLLGTFNSHDLDQLYQEVWTNDRIDVIYNTKTFTQCVTINGKLDFKVLTLVLKKTFSSGSESEVIFKPHCNRMCLK